jgi:hypothetical protein
MPPSSRPGVGEVGVPLWIGILAVVLSAFAVSLTFAVALGRSARRADETVESFPELAELTTRLKPLSAERSPSGRRFFPTPQARRELAEMVHEVLEI